MSSYYGIWTASITLSRCSWLTAPSAGETCTLQAEVYVVSSGLLYSGTAAQFLFDQSTLDLTYTIPDTTAITSNDQFQVKVTVLENGDLETFKIYNSAASCPSGTLIANSNNPIISQYDLAQPTNTTFWITNFDSSQTCDYIKTEAFISPTPSSSFHYTYMPTQTTTIYSVDTTLQDLIMLKLAQLLKCALILYAKQIQQVSSSHVIQQVVIFKVQLWHRVQQTQNLVQHKLSHFSVIVVHLDLQQHVVVLFLKHQLVNAVNIIFKFTVTNTGFPTGITFNNDYASPQVSASLITAIPSSNSIQFSIYFVSDSALAQSHTLTLNLVCPSYTSPTYLNLSHVYYLTYDTFEIQLPSLNLPSQCETYTITQSDLSALPSFIGQTTLNNVITLSIQTSQSSDLGTYTLKITDSVTDYPSTTNYVYYLELKVILQTTITVQNLCAPEFSGKVGNIEMYQNEVKSVELPNFSDCDDYDMTALIVTLSKSSGGQTRQFAKIGNNRKQIFLTPTNQDVGKFVCTLIARDNNTQSRSSQIQFTITVKPIIKIPDQQPEQIDELTDKLFDDLIAFQKVSQSQLRSWELNQNLAAYVININTQGLLTIKFNQDMDFPSNLKDYINLKLFNSEFQTSENIKWEIVRTDNSEIQIQLLSDDPIQLSQNLVSQELDQIIMLNRRKMRY
eukprot:403339012